MFWKPDYRNKVGLSKAKLKQLVTLFETTRGLQHDLPELLLKYVLDDADESVLGQLSGATEAALTLRIRCAWQNGPVGDAAPWGTFLDQIETVDSKFYLRLGKVFEAAAKRLPADRFFCETYFDGAMWLEILLQEATRTTAHCWSSEEQDTSITGAMIEEMLRADGRDPLVFFTAPFRAQQQPEGNQLRHMVKRIAELGKIYARHRDAFAKFLREGNAQTRVQAVEILSRAQAPGEIFIEEFVAGATDSSKLLREASEMMLRAAPEAARPHLERLAKEGDRTQREYAVRLLGRLCASHSRQILESLGETEKSEPVQKALQAALGDLKAVVEAPSLDSVALPAREPITLIAPVTPELRKLLEILFGEYNTFVVEHNQQVNQPPANTPHVFPRQKLPSLTASDLQRTCGLLDQGGQVLGTHAETLSNFRGLLGEIKGTLKTLVEHRDFQLIHVVRLLAMLGLLARPRGHFNGVSWQAEQWLRIFRASHMPPATLVDLSEAIQSVGLPEQMIVDQILESYGKGFDWEPEAVWPFMIAKLDAIERAIEPVAGDSMTLYRWRQSFDSALDVLAKFPRVPPTLAGKLWDMAIGTHKVNRLRAQKIVGRLPDVHERLAQALASGNAQTRLVAAEWMGRRADRRAVPLLDTAAKKEKQDASLDEILTALEKLGQPIEPYLNRERLSVEAAKGLKKGIPAILDWFPWPGLPAIHWQDTGDSIPAEVVTWLLVQNYKLKSPDAGPLLRRYAAMMVSQEREELGRFVLVAWLDQDLKRRYTDDEARRLAKTQGAQSWQAYQRYLQSYAGNKQAPPAYLQNTQQQLEDLAFQQLQRECGSATGEKGLLAVAGACCGATAVAPVQKYLKDWYGYRAAQCKALIAMLSCVDSPAAIQFLLSIANRFRTKGIREEAEKYVRVLAERKGWTLDELADRTMPTAGFEDDGTLELSFGPRAFTLRVTPQLETVLTDASGKVLKTLPAPRKDDDEEQAKAAKKAFSAAKSELKRFAGQQTTRLYEAMCTQRTWHVSDWRTYVAGHPLLKFLCQRLVWAALDGAMTTHTFRPLDDGTLTDYDDNEVTIADDASLRVAHRCQITAEVAAAWATHLADYSVAPLFLQFGREPYELPETRRREAAIRDFEGHTLEAFKLRGMTTKLGYSRGATQDGGCFYDYVKMFPGLGLEVHLNFSGNHLPEENRTVALTDLAFQKAKPEQALGYFGGASLPLADIPAVLLSECYNDLRALAALGTGFDPEWEKKA